MKYSFTNINNSNVNKIARIVLQRILDEKRDEKDFTDIFTTSDEYKMFLKMLNDCEYIDNCGFIETLDGKIHMTINGDAGGIKVSSKGLEYLNAPPGTSYIFL